MEGLAEQYDGVQKNYQGKNGKELIDRLSLKEGSSVLDLGCGTGFLTSLLAERVGQRGRVTGVGPDARRIVAAQRNYAGSKNITFLVGSSENFPDGPYDLIFSSNVLHWIEDKESAFKNVYSSLEKGGTFALLCSTGVTSSTWDLFNAAIMKPLQHYCTVDVYEQLAKKCGFKIKQISAGVNRYTFENADKFIAWATPTFGSINCVSTTVKEKDKEVNFNSFIASLILEK